MSGSAVVGGYPHRVSETGTVTRRERGAWRVLTRAELLALPRTGDVWVWLREQGVRRPSPSGESPAEADRDSVQVKLRLSPRVRDILRDQAEAQGIPVSGLVTELVERTWGRMYEADKS